MTDISTGSRWAPRHSLRRKIMLVVMTATFAALLLSAGALLIYEVYSNRSAWVSDLRSQADLVAQSVTPTLVFDDPKAASDALAAFKLRPQIEVAAVFDANHKLFASYRSRADGTQALPTEVGEDGSRFLGTELELTRSITQNGERVGVIYLRARHDVLGRIVGYLWILGIASAAGLTLAALIFRQLHPAITRPILAMADVSRRIIEDRNYDLRVTASSDDEIGVLVAAFNNMLDDLSVEMKERRTAEDALRAADRRKDEFLATLAHELRNPLAPLTAALALLERADDDPQIRRKTREMMQRQLAQMVRLIDDLLEVSRITRGKLELRRATVEIGSLAHQALEAAESALSKKEHVVAAEIPETPLWINVDAARLIQVFVNLLNNAGKYTPRGGHIGLKISAQDGVASVAFSDDGIGIDASQVESIFDMFVQVDTSLERGAAGLGIGLTIARELVQLHGGTVRARSDGLGHGSTFTVTLPLAAAPTAAQHGGASAPTASSTVGLDILVADDNVDFAESFAAILRHEGHRVRVAHDGHAALQAVTTARPAVAFLDIGMPGLNGFDLAARLRSNAHTRSMMLVAVTGWGQETDRQRVRTAGFDHHLVKPVELQEVLALISGLQAR